MENDSANCVLSSIENGIQKITLNRPKRKNAFLPQTYKRISQLLREATRDDNVRMVVVTGNGDFFSSGNDMSLLSFQENTSSNVDNATKNFEEYVENLILFPKLLVAIVNGPAIGIAVTMLPLFDIVYASDTAYFQTPFTKLGIVSEGCSSYTFPKIMGTSKAGDMLYLCHKMSVQEAKEYHLISGIYDHDRVHEVWSYLSKVSLLSSESIQAVKGLVRRWDKDLLLEINAAEAKALAKRWESPDFIERIVAFMSRKSKM